MEFAEFINGKMLKVHDVETACKNFTDEIVAITRHVQGENKRLQAENVALKDEHYKDAEIQRLLTECQEWKARACRSFEIDEDERAAISEWKEEHIKKKHKGNGYAGEMITWLADTLYEAGVKELYLTVKKDNHSAIRVYEKLGFKVIGKRFFVRLIKCNIPYLSL
jgi:GNAT superfamily N-acetyltransferase